MLNPTELDVRVMNHAARVTYADRFGALCDEPRPARRPRLFVAALLRRTPRPSTQPAPTPRRRVAHP